MMRLRSLVTVGLAATAFLAGCATPGPDIGPDSYDVATLDVPVSAVAGTPFTFTLGMSGPAFTSSHFGAHFWDTEVSDPTAALATAGVCVHVTVPTDIPEATEVTCTLPEAGTYHLFGHLRVVTDDGTQYDYWAEPKEVVAVGDYVLTASGIPTTTGVNETFSFTLNITGPEASTNHVAGHWWPDATPDPTAAFGTQAGNCVIITAADLPDDFTVECTIGAAGTWHLRGHMLLNAAGVTHHFWSAETAIDVADAMP